MGANGRLIHDGASPEKRKTRSRVAGSKSDDPAVEAELIARLEPGEAIRDCAGCGARFVSRGEDDIFCSHARCQRQARSR
jgi:hypothetical protein